MSLDSSFMSSERRRDTSEIKTEGSDTRRSKYFESESEEREIKEESVGVKRKDKRRERERERERESHKFII